MPRKLAAPIRDYAFGEGTAHAVPQVELESRRRHQSLAQRGTNVREWIG